MSLISIPGRASICFPSSLLKQVTHTHKRSYVLLIPSLSFFVASFFSPGMTFAKPCCSTHTTHTGWCVCNVTHSHRSDFSHVGVCNVSVVLVHTTVVAASVVGRSADVEEVIDNNSSNNIANDDDNGIAVPLPSSHSRDQSCRPRAGPGGDFPSERERQPLESQSSSFQSRTRGVMMGGATRKTSRSHSHRSHF